MASLGYANAGPGLKTDAVPDIYLDILNPGKSFKHVGYEKRKKAEINVQARSNVRSKGTQAVTRGSNVGRVQPSLHILSSDMTEDPESCLDLEESRDIDSSSTDQDPDYVPHREVRDVEDMECNPEEILPFHNNKLVDKRYFLLFESRLFELLKIWQHCKSDCVVHVKSVLGTIITVNSTCSHGHTSK